MNELKFREITSNLEETITSEELKALIEDTQCVTAYAGYEPSGRLHLGHLLTAYKLVDLQNAGVNIIILLADLHAYLNEKGTIEQIEEWARYYRSCFSALGLGGNTRYVLGSDYQLDAEYTKLVLRLARDTTLNRARRSMDEVSRNAEDPVVSQMIYPLMQTADIGFLDVDIAVGGIDQRKIHMLAREALHSLGFKTPVCLHTPILLGLDGSKMSSSKDNLIAVEDSFELIKQKIQAAYCPPRSIHDNPIMQLYELYIFPQFREVELKRPERYGGDVRYNSLSGLQLDYEKGLIHPLDLKNGGAIYIEQIIAPIRRMLIER
ncbi:MAG: tyrosine--tRNA ligase [Halobacteriota archaeon]